MCLLSDAILILDWKLTVLLDNNLEKIRINSLNHRGTEGTEFHREGFLVQQYSSARVGADIQLAEAAERTQPSIAAGRSESTSIVPREDLPLFDRVMFAAKRTDGY